MRQIKYIGLVLLSIFMLLTINLEANPVFARQHNLTCNSCHSQVPALNDMGLDFLRNGFRTSSSDTTTLQRLLDTNSSNHYSPIGAIIGLSDDSKSDEANRLVKLYLTGTLTDSLSLMALTKENFNSQKQNQELFLSNNSQLYIQYNFLESSHVVRAGLFSPLTLLGNIERSMGHSGLHINASHGNNYYSPLQNTNIKKIKGAEYSYLLDNNKLFLVSYGEGTNSASEHDFSSKHSSNPVEDINAKVFLSAITHKTESNYKIGLIYNHIDQKEDNQYSLIVPIEKEYPYFIWNSSLAYMNDSQETYFGLENAFTIPLREMEHLKIILNADKDLNNNSNFGYSIGYTNIYNMFFFSITAGRVNTETFSEDKIGGSINIIF